MENNNRNIIILATKKNLDMLKLMLPYCKKNIQHRNIYIIANNSIESEINSIDDAIFYDENDVVKGMNINTIGNIIEDIAGKRGREGWYLQQFIKLGWAYICKDDDYITIDADTIPLNKIDFIDNDNRYLFTRKVEYHKPYFDTINKLFDGHIQRTVDFSFIAENMIFNCECVKEMLQNIINNGKIPGKTFYEKILRSIDPSEIIFNGFSEFETYGNYMNIMHPEMMKIRRLRTQREAVFLIGDNPTPSQLIWASRDYDIISIEQNNNKRTITATLTSFSLIRSLVSIRTFAKVRSRIRSAYRKLTNKTDFKFEEN